MTAQLLIRNGTDPLRTIVLHGHVYRIGRDPDAEVPVMHPAVSKRHALLELRQGRWQLRDQGSTNGLSWQGRRVSWLELRDGDLILYRGDYSYYLEKKAEESAAAEQQRLAADQEEKRKANRQKQKDRQARRKKTA